MEVSAEITPIGSDSYLDTTKSSLLEVVTNIMLTRHVYILCILVAIINNTVYVTVTMSSPRLRNLRSCLTTALSVASLMSAVTLLVALGVSAEGDGKYRPSDYVWPTYCTLIWQAFILLIISADRFVAVIKPLHYHMWITMNRLVAALAVSALLSLAFSLTTFACRSRTMQEAIIFAKLESRSGPALIDSFPKEFFLFIYMQTALYVITGTMICALYVPILLSIRNQIRKVATTSKTTDENNYQQTIRKHTGTVMLSVVIVYFFLIGFGNLLLWAVPSFYSTPLGQQGPINDVMLSLIFLSISAPVINPILYGFVNKSFRASLRSCCGCKPNPIGEELTMIKVTPRNPENTTHESV